MNYIIIPGIGQLVDGNESQEEHSSGEATTLGSGGEIWLKTKYFTIIGLINIKG